MRRSIARLTAGAALGALALVACGGGGGSASSKSPKAELSAGIGNLTDTDVLTMALKLDSTPTAIESFAKESGDTLTVGNAQAIAGALVSIEMKTDNGTKFSARAKSAHTDLDITGSDNGHTLAEIRSTGGALYLQGDIKGVLALAGDSKLYDEVQARAASLPAFVKAFAAGNWVSLQLSALQALAGQFGVTTKAGGTTSVGTKLLSDLQAVFGRDATVTKSGSDSKGDHLVLTANARTLVTDLDKTLAPDVPGAGLVNGRFKSGSVPDKNVTVDAWVKDGTLTEIALDLTQFAAKSDVKPGDTLPIVLTFDRSGADITKPAGATPVDLSQLGTLIGALG